MAVRSRNEISTAMMVLDELDILPDQTAAEIADTLMCPRTDVSTALGNLRAEGRICMSGHRLCEINDRRAATWRLAGNG
jgi:DNA-binding IclR family transcriptional regulator